ncbi:CHC2 zinc finger domain-containing protein [Caldicellulosiruptor acetigenus]|nr:CHC2 zinc finger domain-containing protein [Caldicellulosiruptor acetigenus]
MQDVGYSLNEEEQYMKKFFKQVNIDEHIDYERFYSKYLKNMKRSNDKITAQCPFHDDQHNSFWFRISNGCWKCEAGCGGGNIITFLAKIEGLSTREAYKKLLKEAELLDENKEKGKMKYTLNDYSKEKSCQLNS